jgi:hypothetical protein
VTKVSAVPLTTQEITSRVFGFVAHQIFTGMEEYLGEEHPEYTPEDLEIFYTGVHQVATLYYNRSLSLIQGTAEETMALANHNEAPQD